MSAMCRQIGGKLAGEGDARSLPARGRLKGRHGRRWCHGHAQPLQLLPVGRGIAGRLESPAVPGRPNFPSAPVELLRYLASSPPT